MINFKKLKTFAVFMLTFIVMCVSAPLCIAASDDELDNDTAVQVLSASEFSADAMSDDKAEQYSAAASTYIENY